MTDDATRSADGPLLAYYGDDYTGSTDALEGLAKNGVRTILFVEPPSGEVMAEFPAVDAVGIAGTSRSMTPGEMRDELPSAFEAISALDAPLVHYKVCSTFDSAPEIGSIGTAIDVGQEVFDSSFVPVSQPTESPFGRYVLFGNLFAVQDGVTYRIDRHPTMRDHPVTPMDEADLRKHLGRQTDREIGLVDVRHLGDIDTAESALAAVIGDGHTGERPDVPPDVAAAPAEIVVLDGLTATHLHTIGGVLWRRAREEDGSLFAVGSSGLEHHALTHHWDRENLIPDRTSLLDPQPSVDQIAVVSGSAAPVTAEQIDWAEAHGYEPIRLDTERLVDPDTREDAVAIAVRTALGAIEDGASVILYSARGPDDPAIEATRERAAKLGLDDVGERLGTAQGEIFREVLDRSGLSRGCIAGGDTSGAVLPALDVYALEPIAATDPGAPLCETHARADRFDGLEVTLKGGQTGTREYFELVRRGGSA